MSDLLEMHSSDENLSSLKKEFLSHENDYIQGLLFDPKSTLYDVRDDIGMIADYMRYSFETHGDNKRTGIVCYVVARAAVAAARKQDPVRYGDSERHKNIAMAIGWAMEAQMILHELRDDIAEGRTINKYGRKPWNTIENVGWRGLIDGETVDSENYFYLKRIIEDDDFFFDLFDILEDCKCKVAHGYALDMDGRREPFRLLKSEPTVSEWKGCLFTQLPIKIAALLAGIKQGSPEMASIQQTTSKMARHYQRCKDFEDYFSETKVQQDHPQPPFDGNRCNWLLGYAMVHGSEEQKATLKEIFANRDEESRSAVRKIFNDMKDEFESQLQEEEDSLLKAYENFPVEGFHGVLKLAHQLIFQDTEH